MGGVYADSATWKLPLLSACLQLCAQGGEREHSGTLRNKIRKNKASFSTVSKQSSPSSSATLNAKGRLYRGIRTHCRHNYSLDCFCTKHVLDQFGLGDGDGIACEGVNSGWKHLSKHQYRVLALFSMNKIATLWINK